MRVFVTPSEQSRKKVKEFDAWVVHGKYSTSGTIGSRLLPCVADVGRTFPVLL